MKNVYECIVVGGGMAGSASAIHLARKGYATGVLERRPGPHHKVCGEFLSFETLVLLRELDIRPDDSPLIKNVRLISPFSRLDFRLPVPGRGCSRFKLDEDLLNRAEAAGAHVCRGVDVTGYGKEGDGFTVKTNAGNFYARHLFVATGKHDCSKEHRRRGDDAHLAFKVYLSPVRKEVKETISLFSFPGGYGGLCPVDDHILNLGFIVERMIFKWAGGNFNAVLSFLRRSNAALDRTLRSCSVVGPSSALGHVPYGFMRKDNSQGGPYFVGDQYAVIPSWTGDGMAIALMTARQCTHEFDCRQRGVDFSSDSRQRLKRQMRWALVTHAVLKSAWATEAAILMAKCIPALPRALFDKTRTYDKEAMCDDSPLLALGSGHCRY